NSRSRSTSRSPSSTSRSRSYSHSRSRSPMHRGNHRGHFNKFNNRFMPYPSNNHPFNKYEDEKRILKNNIEEFKQYSIDNRPLIINPHSKDNIDPTRHLWVGRFYHLKMDYDTLYKDFGQFGKIESLNYLKDQQCAFVNFHR